MKPGGVSGFASELPEPDPAALELSRTLSATIAAEIRAAGPLSLQRFWELALYAPGLGYYSNGSLKFGAGGDFVTAPELGNVFGRCLAKPIGQVLADSAPGGRIVELGAGSGALAATLLKELASHDALPDEYAILEVSADLRERQQATLQSLGGRLLERVHWLDRPPEGDWRGVLLANEVVDALPARRFRRTAEGWLERCVDASADGFRWVECPPDRADEDRLQDLEAASGWQLPVGYQTEYQPHLGPWLKSVSGGLRRGLALLIDYGYPRREYYHPQRADGTLIAHYRHRAHADVLRWPGIQDLSVSVDFTALAEAADEAGLEVLGYTSQAQFLLASGLPEILAEDSGDTGERTRLLHQIKLLTLPAEMGERFKVLAAGRGLNGPTAGFEHDQRERL